MPDARPTSGGEGLDTARWARLKEVWLRICDLDDAERGPAIDRECEGDGRLAAELRALLDAESRAQAREGGFLDSPALGDGFRTPGHDDLGREARPSAGPEPGARLGPWRLEEAVGSGGMGEVWRAARDDGAYEQRAAVKFLRRAGGRDQDTLDRFHRERSLLARLEHPSIARLLDGGEAPWGDPYLVMEFVDGLPITNHCETRTLGVDERLALFLEVCAAVQHAHQSLVVHRDLKPANILVDDAGRPRLLDFGIAKVVETEPAQSDVSATLLFTPRYGSPEQVRGRAITTATDVYALGVLLYELLTTRPPFELAGKSPSEVERTICETEPPSLAAAAAEAGLPRSVQQRLRADLQWIVRRAMEKDPARRYSSASAIAADVRRSLAGHVIDAGPPSAAYRLSRFVRRNRLPVAGGAALAATLIVATAVSIAALDREASQRRTAELERAVAQAVNDFLVRTLTAADPRIARGEELTVRTLLDRAAAEIDAGFDGPPLVEAGVRHAIGSTYNSLGEYGDAERHLRAAATLRETNLGPDSPDRATSLAVLGAVLTSVDRHADARPALDEALRIRTVHGNEPAVIDSLIRIGVLQRRMGRFDESAQTLRDAVARARARSAEPTELLVRALDELGVTLFTARHDEAAIEIARESLAGHEALGDAESPDALLALEGLAVSLRRNGRAEEAEPLFARAVPAMRRVFGPDHPETLLTSNNYGSLLISLERYDEAEQVLTDAIARAEASPNVRSGNLATMLDNLAMLYEDLDRPDDAERCYARALDIFEGLYGPEHPDTIIAKHNFGGFLRTGGKPGQALPLLESAVAAAPAAFGDDHWITAHFRGGLGACLGLLGRHEEAEPLLLACEQGVRAKLGESDARTRTACARLIALYESWPGREADAAPWRARVEEIDRAASGAHKSDG